MLWPRRALRGAGMILPQADMKPHYYIQCLKRIVMTNNSETVEVLNDLIQINNDRVAGYEKAIKETKNEDEDLKVL